MSTMRELIEQQLTSSGHLAKQHVHPKLMQLFEAGGMASIWVASSRTIAVGSRKGAAHCACCCGRSRPSVHPPRRALLMLRGRRSPET